MQSLFVYFVSTLFLYITVVSGSSLSWEAFEQYSLWQILRAEVGGRAPLIERFAPTCLTYIDPEGALLYCVSSVWCSAVVMPLVVFCPKV